jgi:hypothetical protein
MADEYQVTMSYGNQIDVTLQSQTNTQVSTSYVVAESLEDLGNVDTSALDKTGNTTNNYVMVYDAVAKKYKFVNPDVVLNTAASATEPVQPGLPQPFIDALDVELDNLIDVDGGGF